MTARAISFALGLLLWTGAGFVLRANLHQPSTALLVACGAAVGVGGVLMDRDVFVGAIAAVVNAVKGLRSGPGGAG